MYPRGSDIWTMTVVSVQYLYTEQTLHFFTPNSCLCILFCKESSQRFGFVSTIVSCDEPAEVLWASAAFSCSFLTPLSWLPWNRRKTDNDLSLDADQRWSSSVTCAQMGGFTDPLALNPIWTRMKTHAVLESQSVFLPYRSCAAVGGATSICPEIQRKSSIDKRSRLLIWSSPCAFYREWERKDGLIMSSRWWKGDVSLIRWWRVDKLLQSQRRPNHYY